MNGSVMRVFHYLMKASSRMRFQSLRHPANNPYMQIHLPTYKISLNIPQMMNISLKRGHSTVFIFITITSSHSTKMTHIVSSKVVFFLFFYTKLRFLQFCLYVLFVDFIQNTKCFFVCYLNITVDLR